MLTFLLDALFPRRCVGCGREAESWICQACQWQSSEWPQEVCPGVHALSPFRQPQIREAIHALKYHSIHELADELVDMLLPPHWSYPPDTVLVPVPTSFSRRKKRGYNQAELIARALGRRLHLPVEPKLLVKTARGTQVGKTRKERAAAGYALRATLPAQPLVLVDDLCTTGSTLRACAAALGSEVPAIVLAAD